MNDGIYMLHQAKLYQAKALLSSLKSDEPRISDSINLIKDFLEIEEGRCRMARYGALIDIQNKIFGIKTD